MNEKIILNVKTNLKIFINVVKFIIYKRFFLEYSFGVVANVAIIFKIIKYIITFLKNCKYSKICQNQSIIGVYH